MLFQAKLLSKTVLLLLKWLILDVSAQGEIQVFQITATKKFYKINYCKTFPPPQKKTTFSPKFPVCQISIDGEPSKTMRGSKRQKIRQKLQQKILQNSWVTFQDFKFIPPNSTLSASLQGPGIGLEGPACPVVGPMSGFLNILQSVV